MHGRSARLEVKGPERSSPEIGYASGAPEYAENLLWGRSCGITMHGLYHLTEGMLERAFVEFKPYLGGCKYYNCRHLAEPQCAVLDAVADGKIARMRHELYGQLLHESAQTLY